MLRPEPSSEYRWQFAGGKLIAMGCGMRCAAAFADGCSDASQDIVTDRPSVTNSSVVVPTGSLQMENGVNWTAHPGQGALDGPNTRFRFGIGGCTEMLVDLPDYTGGIHGHGPSGFSDVAPAIKHQFGGLPDGTNLSATIGLGLGGGWLRRDVRRLLGCPVRHLRRRHGVGLAADHGLHRERRSRCPMAGVGVAGALEFGRGSSGRRWPSKNIARWLAAAATAIGIIALAAVSLAGQGPDTDVRNRADFLSRVIKIATHANLADISFISETLGVDFKGTPTTSPTGISYRPLQNPAYLGQYTYILYWIPSSSKIGPTLTFEVLPASICVTFKDFDDLLPDYRRHQNFYSRTFSYDIKKYPDISNELLVNSQTDEACIYFAEVVENK